MNMVMHVLASNDRCNRVGLLGSCFSAAVLELPTLLFQICRDSIRVAVLDLAILNGSHAVGVLLWKNFAIFDWLDRGVVMVLVDLTINGSLSLFMTLLDYLLLHNRGSDLLVDCGVMVTGLVPE